MTAGRLAAPRGARAAELDSPQFCLGRASGDPQHDSVVLWTRLVPDLLAADGGMPPEPVTVSWELAPDEGFEPLVQRGAIVADTASAHAVHVEVGDHAPDRWYWPDYRLRRRDLGHEPAAGHDRTRRDLRPDATDRRNAARGDGDPWSVLVTI